jgi:type I restriction enzyme, S subunit
VTGSKSNWAKTSFEDIGTLFCGQSPPTPTVNTSGIGTPYITGPEQWDGLKLHQTKWTSDPRSQVPHGCIFITVKGAGVGTMFPGTACAIGRDIYAYLPDALLESGFVAWALQRTIGEVIERARGTIPGLNREHILGQPLDLPPAAEQRRIVTKLNSLASRTAAARAELNRIPMLSARYREAVMRAGCVGRLTAGWRSEHSDCESADDLVARTPEPGQSRGGREATSETIPGQAGLSVNDPRTPLPVGWSWVSLLRVARQETGHTPSRGHADYWDGGVPWIGIRDAGAHHGQVILDTLQTISDLGLENSSARLLPANTVCLSRTASVGYVTVMGRPMATSQDFATWTCTAALEPRYLMYALMAEGDDIRAFGKGSTHTTIYFPEIRALHIALPPIEEQRQIVGLLDAALAEIDRLATEADAARQLLERLDQAILAKAFRGELAPQDPNDEPASALLERIKRGRAGAAPGARRGRRQAVADQPLAGTS